MRLAVALAAVLALTPVAWAEPGLTSEVTISADDLEWLHEQVERISATKSLGVLTDQQIAQMVEEARFLAVTIAVTGDVREMELVDALDALVQAARSNRKQGTAAVVMSQAARDRLGGVTVSASFFRTPIGAAVQALVGAVGSDDPAVEVEETSRGLFVVRVHEEEDEDEDGTGPDVMPQPEEEDDEPRVTPVPGRGGDGIAAPGYLGVQLAAEQEPGLQGVRLGQVVEGGPAARAGLRAGDVLRTFDGEGVTTAAELLTLIQRRSAGEQVEVTILRGDSVIQACRVTLGERPGAR